MLVLFWDASALAKRYAREFGSDVANFLFEQRPPLTMASTPWGYVETFSILRRRLNSNAINITSFEAAVSSLQAEVFQNDAFALLTISDEDIFESIEMIRKHNLNSTDSAILTVVLATNNSPDAPVIIVVASDKRLLRAAELEGLRTLNPEEMPLSELPAFISSLEAVL